MSEKDKMLSNEWYDANFDETLLKERLKAQDLCHDFNQTKPSDEKGQQEIIVELLGYIPKNADIASPFMVDYGYNVELGKNISINMNNYFMDGAEITLGDRVFVGPSCGFYTASHPLDAQDRNKGIEKASPISIGNNVWLGGNVSVMPGVTIGDGCVIGAGSVVTKDIPDNVLAAGVPCKVIRDID